MNRRTVAFHAMLAALPAHIQAAATAAFGMFLIDPQHPALRSHPLYPTKKGQHWPGSISVSVTISYRAIYVVRNGVNLWYWIGSHADYDKFVGRK
jgi:hypothetical protein